MISYRPRRLLALAAAFCVVLPAFAAEPPQSAWSGTCRPPEYPEKALKGEQEGVSLLGFLVRADGTVADTVVLSSSGSRDLDRAALNALSRCVWHRDAKVGDAVDLWVRFTYVWSFTDDPGMHRAKRSAALAAGRGNLGARYNLSVVLRQTAQTEAERQQALVVLRSAAELGHAHAQFELGTRYDTGDGVALDRDEALRWHQKSAAQGDPMAKQRLALGILPG